MDFKKGSIVMLASGGPKMTVEDITVNMNNEPLIICGWFDDKRNYQSRSFPPEALVPGEIDD